MPWGPGIYAQGPSHQWHLWILDVNGLRVIVQTYTFPGTSEEDRAELEAIVESIQIERTVEPGPVADARSHRHSQLGNGLQSLPQAGHPVPVSDHLRLIARVDYERHRGTLADPAEQLIGPFHRRGLEPIRHLSAMLEKGPRVGGIPRSPPRTFRRPSPRTPSRDRESCRPRRIRRRGHGLECGDRLLSRTYAAQGGVVRRGRRVGSR